ncbi:MAG: Yip1 family protein [Candidatus Undinarchaeales archaeon]|jgi:hypothetical protein|nr:Yip1 family protein [Candidatus Undinarchaeales archaeon]
MPSKKNQHDYIPIHEADERVKSKEYAIKGHLSEYPISKWKKNDFSYGAHFSKHVRGMFLFPKATIKRVIDEGVNPRDLFVPTAVVIIAGILTAIGGSLWSILITSSVLISFLSTVKLFIMVFAMPVWLIALWLFWTGVLHVIGSVMSGQDPFNKVRLHKMAKATGFCFVPAFLNILPLFSLVTGYWTWILCAWTTQTNYGLDKKRAFITTIPLLFTTIIGTYLRLSVL